MSEDTFPGNWVKIYCDWSADPVWNADDIPQDPEDLPVSDSLRAELRRWERAWLDGRPGDAEDGGLTHSVHFDVKAHAAWGLVLARRVKTELPDWTVIYFDEWAALNIRRSWRESDRISFEYPV